MKLFRLRSNDISLFGYDEVDDVVVMAQHETHARKLIAKDQNDQRWMDRSLVECEVLPIDTYGILVKHSTAG